ncbi:MAG: hypothetical protein J5I93_05715 [Pirellulaceae bacterium]|nr:hypothetical protein [Pirellulaceae bacterium]
MDNESQSAISGSVTVHSQATPAAANDALRLHPWITQELFAESQRVWSAAYGRELPDEEVIEILLNIRRLAEALQYASKNRRET